MFPVEIRIEHEYALTAQVAGMREWLDHRRIVPTIFRYTFASPGVVFRVEFAIEAEAAAFAAEFGGRAMAATADMPSRQAGSPQAAD